MRAYRRRTSGSTPAQRSSPASRPRSQIGVAIAPGSMATTLTPRGPDLAAENVGEGLDRELRRGVRPEQRTCHTSPDRAHHDNPAPRLDQSGQQCPGDGDLTQHVDLQLLAPVLHRECLHRADDRDSRVVHQSAQPTWPGRHRGPKRGHLVGLGDVEPLRAHPGRPRLHQRGVLLATYTSQHVEAEAREVAAGRCPDPRRRTRHHHRALRHPATVARTRRVVPSPATRARRISSCSRPTWWPTRPASARLGIEVRRVRSCFNPIEQSTRKHGVGRKLEPKTTTHGHRSDAQCCGFAVTVPPCRCCRLR